MTENSGMMPEVQIIPCQMSEERRDKLMAFLEQKIAEEFDSRNTSAWERAIQQYNCKLIPPAQDAYEVQVDTSLSRDRAQQFLAYILNPIFSQDQVFVAVPRWGTDQNMARALDAMSDYVSDTVEDHQFAYEWLEQALILPASPYVVSWEQRIEKRRRWQRIEEPVYDESGAPVMLIDDDGFQYPQTRVRWVEVEETVALPPRARPRCIPLSDFAMDGETPDESLYVLWRIWMTRDEIASMVRAGQFGRDALAAIDEAVEKEKEGVRLEWMAEAGRQPNKRGKYYEVFECYLRWDVEGNGEEEEIVVTYLRSPGIMLRCVYNWWHQFRRPFGVFQYKKIPGTWYGQSLMQLCEPYHRVHGAQLRLRLASALNAVEPLIIDRSGMLREYVRNGRLRRGYVHARGIGSIRDDVEVFWLGQNIPAEAALQSLGSEVSSSLDSLIGITPYLRGIETISRPTASGQMALIEAGRQSLYLAMDRFSREFARMHNIRMAMYRQFFPLGLEVFTAHADDATKSMMASFVQWPLDEYVIETKVSSATMNLNLKKQETIALLDRYPQIMATITDLARAATEPTPTAPIARELLKSYVKTVRTWLRDFRVDDADIIPRLSQALEESDVLATIIQENQALRAQTGVPAAGDTAAGGMGVAGLPPNQGSPDADIMGAQLPQQPGETDAF